jgi:cytochrome oxidase Cu insertion factor (SCO1/SenC/PrrC family)
MGRRVVALLALLLLAPACRGNSDGGSQLGERDRAPDFTLPSAEGERVALGDFADRKPVLLYFSMGPG